MKHENTIDPADMADHEIGLEIIRVLGLRRKRENGRIETTHGDKNPCGLARTLRHLVGDAGRIASLRDALAAAESELERMEAATGHPCDESAIMGIRNTLKS